MLDNFSLLLRRRAAEVVELYIEPSVDVFMYLMVASAELAGCYTLLQGLRLACRAVLVSTAYIERLITAGAAETCEYIRTQHLCQVPQVRDFVYIR